MTNAIFILNHNRISWYNDMHAANAIAQPVCLPLGKSLICGVVWPMLSARHQTQIWHIRNTHMQRNDECTVITE